MTSGETARVGRFAARACGAMRSLGVPLLAAAMLVMITSAGGSGVAQAHVTPTHECGGIEAVVNGNFEGPLAPSTPPASWPSSVAWATDASFPQTDVFAARHISSFVPDANVLIQVFSPAVRADCFIYHVFANGGLPTTFQATVIYDDGGPDDVSMAVHPSDGSPYMDVSPAFDPTRFISAIKFEVIGPLYLFASIDNVSIGCDPQPGSPCTRPTGVGGTTELFVQSSDASAAPTSGSGPSTGAYAAMAGGAAAAAFVLVTGFWYGRRRWLR